MNPCHILVLCVAVIVQETRSFDVVISGLYSDTARGKQKTENLVAKIQKDLDILKDLRDSLKAKDKPLVQLKMPAEDAPEAPVKMPEEDAPDAPVKMPAEDAPEAPVAGCKVDTDCGAYSYCTREKQCQCQWDFHRVDGECVSRCGTCGTNTYCGQNWRTKEWKCQCMFGAGDGLSGCEGCKSPCTGANEVCTHDWKTKKFECKCKYDFATVGSKCIKKYCRYDQFSCCDGECKEAKVRCNGKNECSDGSDEVGCYTGQKKCKPWKFQCTNGNCVWMSDKCNQKDDCGDNSDERCCYRTETSNDVKTMFDLFKWK